MYTIQITSDDDYDLLQFPTKREGVSIVVEDRASATTTIGYMGKDGLFHAYADGALTDADTHAIVGCGVRYSRVWTIICITSILNIIS